MGGGIVEAGQAGGRLSDRAVRAFVVASRAGKAAKKKLADGGGLYLMLTPAGTAVWRVKYRLGGSERLYSVGTYPEIRLVAARAERERVKGHVREGRDPLQARRLSRAVATSASDSTFGAAAEDWLARQKRGWSAVHYKTSRRALERDVLPALGRLPVGEITPAMMASVIDGIMKRGVRDTAAKILWHCVCIFRLAQARGLCRDNPAIPARELLPRRKQPTHRPAFLEFKKLGEVLRGAETVALSPAVRLAHRLCAFTAVRIGNVVAAEWKEFDFDSNTPTWTIPRAKMKATEREYDHKVLLGPTISAELRKWKSMVGAGRYVFPSRAGKGHVTPEGLEKVYRVTLKLSDKHTLHGWRAAFATLARDAGFSRDVVELTLDHAHDTAVARAYDRGERLAERVKLMHWWDTQLVAAQHRPSIALVMSSSAA
jgi:integrase